MTLNWDDLRYFLAVERGGSTLAAARHLKVSQPTVARRIGALERALGTSLFERLPSGYDLTEAGRELLPRAQEMQANVEAVFATVSARARAARAVVRITLDEIYAVTVLAQAFTELRDRYPELRIDLDTTGEIRNLAGGEAEVAIRSCVQPEDPNLVGRRLFADNFGFYCSREYAEKNGLPRTTSELAQHRIIGGGGGGIARAYDRWLMAKGLNDAVVMHHGSAMGLLTAAKSGAGISALPCIVAEGEPDLIRCFPATRDNPSFLWLLTHARLRMNPHVRAVVDFLYPRLRRLAPRTTN
jgi:DNA-binding transcriptional LysR family regulator